MMDKSRFSDPCPIGVVDGRTAPGTQLIGV